jgi:hypothetical protein
MTLHFATMLQFAMKRCLATTHRSALTVRSPSYPATL